MSKTYETLKIETEILKRFKRAKNLLEFQNNIDYSMSDFINILVDNMGKNLPGYFDKLKKS